MKVYASASIHLGYLGSHDPGQLDALPPHYLPPTYNAIHQAPALHTRKALPLTAQPAAARSSLSRDMLAPLL